MSNRFSGELFQSVVVRMRTNSAVKSVAKRISQLRKRSQKAEKISGPKLLEHYVIVADYTKQEKGELSVMEGCLVEVAEKSDSGWWFVHVDDEQGWVPSSYLERQDGMKEDTTIRAKVGEEEKYMCTDKYIPQGSDEIALERGAVVEVIEKNLGGWWIVRHRGKEGVAPSTYLVKVDSSHAENLARHSGVEIISSLSEVSDLLKGDNKDTSNDMVEDSHLYSSILKNRSLERGGSIRPPPRQNTIKVKTNKRSSAVKNKQYVTMADFEDQVGDGITFKKGDAVTVIEKTDSGWWFVKIQDQEGWAPTNYIQEQGMASVVEDEPVCASASDDEWEDSTSPNPGGQDFTAALAAQRGSRGSFSSSGSDDEWDEIPEPAVTKPAVDNDRSGRKSPILASSRTEEGNSQSDHTGERKSVLGGFNLLGALKHKFQTKEEKTEESDHNSVSKPQAPPKSPGSPAVKAKPDLPAKSEVGHATDRKSVGVFGGNSQLADVLKSKFESRQSHIQEPVKKKNEFSVRPKTVGNLETQNRSEEPGSGSNPLADVLKSKFESRQTNFQEVVTKQSDQPSRNKASQAVKPLHPPKAAGTADSASKSLFPPKVPTRPVTPPKVTTRQSESTPSDGSSNLTEVLKAKFESRSDFSKPDRPSKTESTKKTFPTKPLVPGKGAVPGAKHLTPQAKTESEQSQPASGIAAALKSKFEVKGTNEVPLNKPGIRNNQHSHNGTSASLISKFESKESPRTPSTAKPSLSQKPVVKPSVDKSQVNVNKNESVVPKGNVAGLANALRGKLNVGAGAGQTSAPPSTTTATPKPAVVKPMVPPPNPPSPSKSRAPSKSRERRHRACAAFSGANEGEIGFREGDELKVLEKTDDWWFVEMGDQEGWAPAAYIEEITEGAGATPSVSEQSAVGRSKSHYKTSSAFEGQEEGELCFDANEDVEVLDSDDGGWSYVRINGQEGYAPSSYITEM